MKRPTIAAFSVSLLCVASTGGVSATGRENAENAVSDRDDEVAGLSGEGVDGMEEKARDAAVEAQYPKITDLITENLESFVEMHKALRKGDFETARFPAILDHASKNMTGHHTRPHEMRQGPDGSCLLLLNIRGFTNSPQK